MDDKRLDRVRHTSYIAHPNFESSLGFFLKQNEVDEDAIYDPEALPIPPEPLLKYNGTPERYINSGKRDAGKIRNMLVQQGIDRKRGPGRFLEFGCANARVLRWFANWARHHEGWGVDIDSQMVMWCHQNLSSTFQFAVSTTQPHLFFEDNYFSFIFATSIFTHIDDMYLSWLCELKRVTKPGGLVMITIHDEKTHEIQAQRKNSFLNKRTKNPVYTEYMEKEGDFCSCGRDMSSLVSFKREYFLKHVSKLFEVVAVEEEVMTNQTGILLRKRCSTCSH